MYYGGGLLHECYLRKPWIISTHSLSSVGGDTIGEVISGVVGVDDCSVDYCSGDDCSVLILHNDCPDKNYKPGNNSLGKNCSTNKNNSSDIISPAMIVPESITDNSSGENKMLQA